MSIIVVNFSFDCFDVGFVLDLLEFNFDEVVILVEYVVVDVLLEKWYVLVSLFW